MRDILFRGKRVDNGEWIYGSALKVTVNGNCMWLIFGDSFTYDGVNLASASHALVTSDSVGQYTGVTDIDGNKIFEGDILDGYEYPFCRTEENVHNYFAEVFWCEDACGFAVATHKYPEAKVRGVSDGFVTLMDDFASELWKVVGNVWDNEELLRRD